MISYIHYATASEEIRDGLFVRVVNAALTVFDSKYRLAARHDEYEDLMEWSNEVQPTWDLESVKGYDVEQDVDYMNVDDDDYVMADNSADEKENELYVDELIDRMRQLRIDEQEIVDEFLELSNESF